MTCPSNKGPSYQKDYFIFLILVKIVFIFDGKSYDFEYHKYKESWCHLKYCKCWDCFAEGPCHCLLTSLHFVLQTLRSLVAPSATDYAVGILRNNQASCLSFIWCRLHWHCILIDFL